MLHQVLECLGDFWSSSAQLRTQLTFISIKYPLTISIVSDNDNSDPYLHVTVTILFTHTRAKAYVSFILDMPTFSQWPLSIGSLQTDVKVAYGNIE